MRDKKKILLIIVIILVCLISGIVYLVNTQESFFDNDGTINNQDGSDSDTNVDDIEVHRGGTWESETDLSNTENVKIVDKVKYNISEKVREVHEYEQIKIEDMKITADYYGSYLEFTITNLSIQKEYSNYHIFMGFLDKDGEMYLSWEYVVPSLALGESIKVEERMFVDVSNAYDYEFFGFLEEHEFR